MIGVTTEFRYSEHFLCHIVCSYNFTIIAFVPLDSNFDYTLNGDVKVTTAHAHALMPVNIH